jgi:hypothetical protein
VNFCTLLERAHLQDAITQVYAEYQSDPFVIARLLSHIFLVPSECRLSQDIDTITCFLATFNASKLAQKAALEKMANMVQQFFSFHDPCPPLFPPVIQIVHPLCPALLVHHNPTTRISLQSPLHPCCCQVLSHTIVSHQ